MEIEKVNVLGSGISVLDDLKSASNSSSALRLGEEMIAMTVCRHAVKAKDALRAISKLKSSSRICSNAICPIAARTDVQP